MSTKIMDYPRKINLREDSAIQRTSMKDRAKIAACISLQVVTWERVDLYVELYPAKIPLVNNNNIAVSIG